MTLLAQPTTPQLTALRAEAHPRCVVCGSDNPLGLRLGFRTMPDGSVEGEMMGGDGLEGYSGCLHSGVIAALLDGAMTNCLFAHGCRAFTAELTVRYRQAVAAQDRVTVRAWLTRSRPPLRLLRAELRQGACVKATAVGKFIESYE